MTYCRYFYYYHYSFVSDYSVSSDGRRGIDKDPEIVMGNRRLFAVRGRFKNFLPTFAQTAGPHAYVTRKKFL